MTRWRPLRLALPLLLAAAVPAAAQSLPPHKDNLFAYPETTANEDGGAFRAVAYDEARDIDRRDQVPEKMARGQYVALGVRRSQQDLTADTAAGPVRHVAVGRRTGASLIVVYIHGQGGSRKQGVDDWTFGGNFNRIKNLVVAAGGVYLSPDFSDFKATGTAQVAGLISSYAATSPRARVVVACGSMGGALCWSLARDAAVAEKLAGLVLLGSFTDGGFLSSEAFRRRVPVFLGQGGADKVFPAAKVEAFYRAVRARAPGYPIRMVRFDTGSHGTPIRMVDWRETVNWMLSR